MVLQNDILTMLNLQYEDLCVVAQTWLSECLNDLHLYNIYNNDTKKLITKPQRDYQIEYIKKESKLFISDLNGNGVCSSTNSYNKYIH